jgi:hypothetical protein
MSLEKMVEYFKQTDLNGLEIQNLIGRPPVLYSDLAQYSSVDKLLGDFNYCIILYQTSSRTSGHFVALTRNDTTGKIRFFDSYGFFPDQERQFTKYDQMIPPYLTQLLKGHDFEYNNVDYQAKQSNITTCGRHSSMACHLRNLSLAQIKEFYTDNKSQFLNKADNSVTLLTMLGLHDIRKFFTAGSRSDNY